MFLTRWNPMKELTTLHHELDDFFKKSFDVMGEWKPSLFGEGIYPSVESFIKDGKLFFRAEVSGVDPKDIDISVAGNRLILKGERKHSKEIKEDAYLMKEFSYGSFERALTLPEGVNTDKIHATFKDGILELSMPYVEGKLPRKIPVEIEGKFEAKKAA